MTTVHSFGFDNLDIIGGFKNKVHVVGLKMTYNEDDDYGEAGFEDCILSIDRKVFHKMLDAWLDDKLSICDYHQHYCGVMGSVRCEVKQIDDITKNDFIVYEVLSWDEDMDMEHG